MHIHDYRGVWNRDIFCIHVTSGTKQKDNMAPEKNITTRWSRWKVGGAEQAVLEHAFHETSGFPTVTDRSSLACVLDSTERRIQVWFQNQRQRGKYEEDTKAIASLGLNTILLMCIMTRQSPDVPYDEMARYVQTLIDSVGVYADHLVRYHVWSFVLEEARRVESDTIDQYDAVHIATTGLITRVANVLGLTNA